MAWAMATRILHLLPLLSLSAAQRGGGVFELPDLSRSLQPAKPKVDADMAQYFGLQGQAQSLVDSLLGPRPGGVIPPRSFDVEGERPRQNFFNGFGGGPPGTNAGGAANFQSASFGGVLPTRPNFQSGSKSGSSISGIPNIFPDLPKAPRVAPGPPQAPQGQTFGGVGPAAQQGVPSSLSVRQNVQNVASAPVNLPQFPNRPQVPNGGLGPLGLPNSQTSPQNIGQQATNNFNPQQQQFGSFGSPGSGGQLGQQNGNFAGQNFGAGAQQDAGAAGGLLNNIFNMIGLGANGQLQNGGGGLGDLKSILAQRQASPASSAASAGQGNDPAGSLNNILYKALTNGVIQPQSDTGNDTDSDGTGPQLNQELLQQGTAETLAQNIGLIQQLITQPNSPLCSPKPQPVDTFDLAAFMGTWYQVLYSPPMSVGPCNKKLADVNNGGPGSVFDTFEYTTEGTPFGPPRISSGYAIVRAPGQLIYRTTSSDTDVNVNVIAVGPRNSVDEYEWAVLSVNCNYPLHVFARDPVRYKQLYEPNVSAMLEQNGMVTGFTRMLNVVAPVDNSLCHFPPTLFNI